MLGVISELFWRGANWLLDTFAMLYATVLDLLGMDKEKIEAINKWAFRLGPLIQLIAAVIVVVVYVLPARLYLRAGILLVTMILLYDYWIIGIIIEAKARFNSKPRSRISKIEA